MLISTGSRPFFVLLTVLSSAVLLSTPPRSPRAGTEVTKAGDHAAALPSDTQRRAPVCAVGIAADDPSQILLVGARHLPMNGVGELKILAQRSLFDPEEALASQDDPFELVDVLFFAREAVLDVHPRLGGLVRISGEAIPREPDGQHDAALPAFPNGGDVGSRSRRAGRNLLIVARLGDVIEAESRPVVLAATLSGPGQGSLSSPFASIPADHPCNWPIPTWLAACGGCESDLAKEPDADAIAGACDALSSLLDAANNKLANELKRIHEQLDKDYDDCYEAAGITGGVGTLLNPAFYWRTVTTAGLVLLNCLDNALEKSLPSVTAAMAAFDSEVGLAFGVFEWQLWNGDFCKPCDSSLHENK